MANQTFSVYSTITSSQSLVLQPGTYRFHVIGRGGDGGRGSDTTADAGVNGGRWTRAAGASGASGSSGAYSMREMKLTSPLTVNCEVSSTQSSLTSTGLNMVAKAGVRGGNADAVRAAGINTVYPRYVPSAGDGDISASGGTTNLVGVRGQNGIMSKVNGVTFAADSPSGASMPSGAKFGGVGGRGYSAMVDVWQRQPPNFNHYGTRGEAGGNYGAGGGGGGASYSETGQAKAFISATGGAGGTGGPGAIIIEKADNRAPNPPGAIAYNGTPTAGHTLSITCGTSIDPDGDPVSYMWERSVNSGAFTSIGTTTSPSITDTVPSGSTYQVRVKAVDNQNAQSAYTTGSNVAIFVNTPPTISGTDIDLGYRSNPITYEYTVEDVDANQTVTVTEKVISGDNTFTLRSFNAQRGASYTADMHTIWLMIGACRLVIEANDGNGGFARRTITFTRLTNRIAASRTISTEIPVEKCRIILLPEERSPGSELTLQVCNNPFDDAPVWEDISHLANGEAYMFQNTFVQTPGIAYRFGVTKGSGTVEVMHVTVKYS